MAKALELMSATEIQKAYDAASAKISAMCDEFISAGRGHERPVDIRKMTDPLAMSHNAIYAAFDAIVSERDDRKRYHGSLKPIRRAA